MVATGVYFSNEFLTTIEIIISIVVVISEVVVTIPVLRQRVLRSRLPRCYITKAKDAVQCQYEHVRLFYDDAPSHTSKLVKQLFEIRECYSLVTP